MKIAGLSARTDQGDARKRILKKRDKLGVNIFVDARLIEELLWQEESEQLDFKEQQYPFIGATDEQKSELLKDILSFANAWRQGEAFILIGVREVRGGRSVVVGVNEHLEDSNVQQFVNSKTQRPLRFSYTALPFEGTQIGVISIPRQVRPFYLTRQYGRLSQNAVYVRRGTATDEAKPDEIASMGADAAQTEQHPLILVEFVDQDGESLGQSIDIASEVLSIPDKEEIPLLSGLGMSDMLINRQYLREFATYLWHSSLLRPLKFRVFNPSGTLATNVRAELTIPFVSKLLVGEKSDFPLRRPRTSIIESDLDLPQIGRPQAVCFVAKRKEKWGVTLRVDRVQPKASVRVSGAVHIGASEPMDVLLSGAVFADNLANPTPVSLSIRIATTHRTLNVEDLKRLGREIEVNEDD